MTKVAWQLHKATTYVVGVTVTKAQVTFGEYAKTYCAGPISTATDEATGGSALQEAPPTNKPPLARRPTYR